MKNTKIFLIAALLGTVLAGCQTELEIEPVEQPVLNKTVTLTVQASKNVDTKALSLEGNTLSAYWIEGEEVAVYISGSSEPQGTLTAGNITTVEENSVATLTGEISVACLVNGENTLSLLFPGREDENWTYEGQDGTAPAGTMASMFDYAMATLTVNYNEAAGTITPSGNASFVNQQSIFRFGFNMSMSSFTVSSAQNQLVTSRSFEGSSWVSTTGPLIVTPGSTESTTYYVSLRNENTTVDDWLYFYYIGTDNKLYEGSKKVKSAHLDNGKYLGATVTMAQKTLAQSETSISTVL